MVGFNNIGFDYPVLHYIQRTRIVLFIVFIKKAMGLINAEHDDRFKT